jgi:hypothetical protein
MASPPSIKGYRKSGSTTFEHDPRGRRSRSSAIRVPGSSWSKRPGYSVEDPPIFVVEDPPDLHGRRSPDLRDRGSPDLRGRRSLDLRARRSPESSYTRSIASYLLSVAVRGRTVRADVASHHRIPLIARSWPMARLQRPDAQRGHRERAQCEPLVRRGSWRLPRATTGPGATAFGLPRVRRLEQYLRGRPDGACRYRGRSTPARRGRW